MGTGSVGGEAFTYVKTGTRKMPGTVSLSRAALLSAPSQRLSAGRKRSPFPADVGRHNERDSHALAIVVREVSPTALSYDGGNNQGGVGTRNDVTLNTAGARIVMRAAAAHSIAARQLSRATGWKSRPTPDVKHISLDDDLTDRRGASDTYSFASGKYVISGAAFRMIRNALAAIAAANNLAGQPSVILASSLNDPQTGRLRSEPRNVSTTLSAARTIRRLPNPKCRKPAKVSQDAGLDIEVSPNQKGCGVSGARTASSS